MLELDEMADTEPVGVTLTSSVEMVLPTEVEICERECQLTI